jgi:plastocyanin
MGFRSLSPRRRVLAGAVALLTPMALVSGAESAHAAATPVTWTVLVGNQAAHRAIQGEKFLTGDITIDQGDTVTWKANSAEPHTVTFIDGGAPQVSLAPFDPVDPNQNSAQGGDTMNGAGYYNSGILSRLDAISILPAAPVRRYSLTFSTPGTYTYYCLVHGLMMRGVVHVQGPGDPYPATQADIDADAAFLANAIVADGRAIIAQAKAASTNHKVITGGDDGYAMVMRFIGRKVVVHKGDTVRWVNNMSMGAPHTVTIGNPHVGPGILDAYGRPGNYKGGDLSSSIIPPHGKFLVTFKKVGKFHYYCLLHSDLGMKGLVVVKP